MNDVTKEVTVERPQKTAMPARKMAELPSLEDLRHEVESVFDRFVGGWPRRMGSLFDWDPFREVRPSLTMPEWRPRADVRETDKAYQIDVELPGVDEKDVEVTMTDDLMTVRGEKKAEREEKEEGYYLAERTYGSFQRSFRLPEDVDADKIGAEFSKGVLRVTLPKSPEAQAKTRKIKVKAK